MGVETPQMFILLQQVSTLPLANVSGKIAAWNTRDI